MNEDEKGEAEFLFDVVRERYGERLSAEELDEVKKGVDRVVEDARALRSVALETTDEPTSVFTPFREDG